VKDGFSNHHEYKALALLGYSFDLVNEVHTHVVLLFLLKTMWARGDILFRKVAFYLSCHVLPYIYIYNNNNNNNNNNNDNTNNSII